MNIFLFRRFYIYSNAFILYTGVYVNLRQIFIYVHLYTHSTTTPVILRISTSSKIYRGARRYTAHFDFGALLSYLLTEGSTNFNITTEPNACTLTRGVKQKKNTHIQTYTTYTCIT